ncbi:signal peptidase II [Kangiella japonica]|uniref:Lipoprotein signal peptidase n=1 Tax=Kangiella japonica TaxID=647384 RepID=A0ABN0STJ8_9GAMM
MLNKIKESGLVWLWITVTLLILDQATKIWADNNLAPVYGGPIIEVMPHFDLNLAYNYGAAFSFLGDAGGWQRWLFTAIAAAISVVLLVWMYKTPKSQKLANVGMALILSGAIGNLYDRLAYGYVIDFIDWYVSKDGYHWPTFNIADSVILMGVGLLVIDTFKNPDNKDEKKTS